MRNSSLVLCICLLVAGPLAATPQNAVIDQEPPIARTPHLIIAGLDELKDLGPEAAEKIWAKGSRMEAMNYHTIASKLHSFQDYSGAYQDFDVISVQDLTPKMRVVYLVLNYEKEPEFVKFVVYRTHEGWILLHIQFDIDEETFEPILAGRQ